MMKDVELNVFYCLSKSDRRIVFDISDKIYRTEDLKSKKVNELFALARSLYKNTQLKKKRIFTLLVAAMQKENMDMSGEDLVLLAKFKVDLVAKMSRKMLKGKDVNLMKCLTDRVDEDLTFFKIVSYLVEEELISCSVLEISKKQNKKFRKQVLAQIDRGTFENLSNEQVRGRILDVMISPDYNLTYFGTEHFRDLLLANISRITSSN